MKHPIVMVVCSLISVLTPALAQSDQARLVGTVADPSGASVASAALKIHNEKTDAERVVKANEQGFYIITGLAPAPYTVTASGEGLGPTEFKSVLLAAGQERTL